MEKNKNIHPFKPKNMRTILLLLLLALLVTACNKDDGYPYSYNDPTIYSASGEVVFSEIILFLKPFINSGNERKYIATDSLRNIVLKINQKTWTATGSYLLDTAHIHSKSTENNYRVTSEPVSYPVQIPVISYPPTFETAGQYADLLNSYFQLTPGAYICQLLSFDIQGISETTTIYTPLIVFPIEIQSGQKSLHVGEFEIQINP